MVRLGRVWVGKVFHKKMMSILRTNASALVGKYGKYFRSHE